MINKFILINYKKDKMYVPHKFELPADLVEEIKNKKSSFDNNGIGELVFYRTYSRKKEDGKTWNFDKLEDQKDFALAVSANELTYPDDAIKCKICVGSTSNLPILEGIKKLKECSQNANSIIPIWQWILIAIGITVVLALIIWGIIKAATKKF